MINKGILSFGRERLLINSVDIVEITDFMHYVKWVNQRRPKRFIVNGKIEKLWRDKTYWEKQLQFIKQHNKKEQQLKMDSIDNNQNKELLENKKNIIKTIK